jgi:hypothetical protein
MDLNYTGLLNDIYSGNNITSHINTNYDYVIDNIDNTVSNCHEETENVTDIITIKNNMMHILNSIEGDTNASDTIPDKLIKLTDLYEDFRKEYLQEQEKFIKSERYMNNMISLSKSNIKKLNVVIDFMREIDDKDCKDQLNETIIDNLKQYSKNMGDNCHLEEAKKEYTGSRKSIIKYLDVIKKLNKLNISNTCPTCLTNPVNIYLNPCGHTLCGDCYDRINIDQEKKCFLCRTRVLSKFPLYFS